MSDQCEAASAPNECAAVCPVGEGCDFLFSNSSCAAEPAGACAPAPAPALGATGVTAAVILLSGVAAMRLRRAARPRQR